jgi:hypothetical protein
MPFFFLFIALLSTQLPGSFIVEDLCTMIHEEKGMLEEKLKVLIDPGMF